MTVSVMSLLGAKVNLSAGNGSDEAGTVTLTSNGDAAFETVMAASEQQEVSAEALRAFFKAHGAEVPAGLDTKGQTLGEVLAQVMAAQEGQKLPGDLMVALQEVLPQGVFDAVEQGVADIRSAEGVDLFSDLPARELTPEELSELVRQTGLSPVVIFAALQNTPAASPNLAHAMVEDMGSAELDANLPLPNGKAHSEAAKAAAIASAATGGAAQTQEATRASNQIAAVDFAAMHDSKRDVLKRIVDVLRGDKAQGELDWTAKTPANNNQPAAPSAKQQAQAAQPFASTQGEVSKQASASPKASDAAVTALMEKSSAAGTGNATPAPQQAAPAEAAAPQTTSFAATLEQGSSLRSVQQGGLEAQLRQPAPQQPVLEQVTVQVRNALNDGASRMEIHLKPAELGRVDVRIDTDADGRSHVTVTADKRDTLDLLQRDSRLLERALADAGLKTDSNGLSFNMRGEGQQQAKGEENNKQSAAFDLNGDYADDIDSKLDSSEMALTYSAGRAYRLNLDAGVDISV